LVEAFSVAIGRNNETTQSYCRSCCNGAIARIAAFTESSCPCLLNLITGICARTRHNQET
jgi:hypothetical protein